ncbi:MAG: EAL domain-containing protein [Spirochaetia bacterium]|nr:EAL domain-containing protein [Spirochaetia bacterium]
MKPDSSEQNVERRQIQLLAMLLRILIPGGAIVAIAQLSFVPGFFPVFLVLMGAVALLGIAFLLTRSGNYRSGAILTALITLGAALGSVFAQPDNTIALAFLILPVMFSSLFLRTRPTGAVAVTVVAIAMLLPMLSIHFTYSGIGGSLAFLVVFGSLITLENWHRFQVERDRREKLVFAAMHDSLTGLLNRRAFEEELRSLSESAAEFGVVHALLYLDLDEFKIVNDTCGHTAGDELLRELSIYLSEHIHAPDSLARLGGDEFGVLLMNSTKDKALAMANVIRHLISNFQFVWGERTFRIGVSIGLVMIDRSSEGLGRILSSADEACYAAKSGGGRRIYVYSESDDLLALRHKEMLAAAEINQAVRENRLTLYRQTIAARKGGHDHYEILLRLQSKTGEIQQPSTFIPAAERFNLMPILDRWVVDAVLKNFSAFCPDTWKTGREGQPVFAVNLSGQSLSEENFIDFIRDRLRKYGTPHGAICFELTETAVVSNLDVAANFMKELRLEGCHFSLDDFGSGLSSFGYLKRLPVDSIKIDGQFVVKMHESNADREIVRAIHSVSHALGLSTIAEWVTSAEVLAELDTIGLDFVQGFYIDKPQSL